MEISTRNGKSTQRPTDREGPYAAESGPRKDLGNVRPGVGGAMPSVWAPLQARKVKEESGTAPGRLSVPWGTAGRFLLGPGDKKEG